MKKLNKVVHTSNLNTFLELACQCGLVTCSCRCACGGGYYDWQVQQPGNDAEEAMQIGYRNAAGV